MTKHSLIVKYLEIISEQESMLQVLEASNKTLQRRNKELEARKNIYKDSAKEWKLRADELRNCLSEAYTVLKKSENGDSKKRYAIKMYKESSYDRVQ